MTNLFNQHQAEWEKAARGGLEYMLYPWGNDTPTCNLGVANRNYADPNSTCWGSVGVRCASSP